MKEIWHLKKAKNVETKLTQKLRLAEAVVLPQRKSLQLNLLAVANDN
jgi:hypothetical protein